MTIHRAPLRRSIFWNYLGIALVVAALIVIVLAALS